MASLPYSQVLLDRNDAACWKDVKSETGFNTYEEYLQAHRSDDNPSNTTLKDYLEGFKTMKTGCSCSIFDISQTASPTKSLTLPRRGLELGDYSTEILSLLRNPLPEVLARVVLLQRVDITSELDSGFYNAVGLGLRIAPQFFEAYLARTNYEDVLSQKVPFSAGYGTIGCAVFMVARNYLAGRPHCPPVVLIMGDPAPDSADAHSHLLTRHPETFAKPALRESSIEKKMRWPKAFELVFREHMNQYNSTTVDLNAVLVHALLPLVETSLEQLKAAYDHANDQFLRQLQGSVANNYDDTEEDMESARFRLRREMRQHELCMSGFIRYLRNQSITDLDSYKAFFVIKENTTECLDDARNLEAEVRDWLQLLVGSLALQESKKSIQLSNSQIEESKRVKIVTFLAFVYVPLNLATSIFGMNIQQLNGDGQTMWIFVMTAAIALFLTFFIWVSTEEWVEFFHWRKQMRARPRHHVSWPTRGKDYNLTIRIAILILLLWNGHARWVRVTRAWIRILTNERAGVRREDHDQGKLASFNGRPRTVKRKYPHIEKYYQATICDYVCEYIAQRDAKSYFHPGYFITQAMET